MSPLAECHMKILLLVYKCYRKYSYEQLIKEFNTEDVQYLMQNKYIRIDFGYDEDTREVAYLTGIGKSAVDAYLALLDKEEKEKARWKRTNIISIIGIGVSIITLIILIIK